VVLDGRAMGSCRVWYANGRPDVNKDSGESQCHGNPINWVDAGKPFSGPLHDWLEDGQRP
jgi:hypothetical protein